MSEHTSTHVPHMRSIGDVVQLLKSSYPEISESSLRFFEQIGLITPYRTRGRHRLYGDADIERIRSIKRLQTQRYSLSEIRALLETADGGALADVNEFLSLATSGDAIAASETVARMIDLGASAEEVIDSLLSPALHLVGEQWAGGRIGVSQEKEASEIVRDLVATLTAGQAIRSVQHQPSGGEVVAACVAGERHMIGLQMIAGLLRRRGYAVRFLGADVDPVFLTDAIRRHHPPVVLLSATLAERLPDIEMAVQAIRGGVIHGDQPQIVVGGQITARHASELEALEVTAVADDLPPGQVVAHILHILGETPPAVPSTVTSTTP